MKIKSPIESLKTSNTARRIECRAILSSMLAVCVTAGVHSSTLADSSEFVAADARSESMGIAGFVVEGGLAEPVTVHVLSAELFASIEKHDVEECITVLVARSAITGEQAQLRFDADGVAEFTVEGTRVATLAFGTDRMVRLTADGELPENKALRALAAAALDSNLDLAPPCTARPQFVVPIESTLVEGEDLWSVDTATVARSGANGTNLTFIARKAAVERLWQVTIAVDEHEVALAIRVDGVPVLALRRGTGEFSLTSPHGAAVAALGSPVAPPEMAAIRSGTEPQLDFAVAVLQVVSVALDNSISDAEVMEQCRQACNDELPYGSNCETITEKYDCCVTDVQRATCRRGCFAHYYCSEPDASLWWCGYQGGKIAILYEIDVASCAAAFLQSWKD